MNLFLLTFFAVYGTAHGYFLLRTRQGLALGGRATLWLSLWLLLMVVSPLAVRLLERDEHENLARLTAYVGYSWMGFLFLFVVLMFLIDLLRLAHQVTAYFVRLPKVPLFAPRPLLLFCVLVASAICCYGLFEAQALRVEQVVVPTDKLPAGAQRMRIALISDLHIGLIVREKQVQRVVEAIRASRADLVVATGDIVDGHVSHFDGVSNLFRQLQPGLGMIAIPGNHEYYAGFGQSRRFMEQSGFRFLRSEALGVGDRLWVVGLDDPVAARSGDFSVDAEQRLLSAVPKGRFVLLLKHRPVVLQASTGQFDLQLSGHVHKGQIFPFNLLTWLNFPVRAGLSMLPHQSRLYVSRGSGTWGPPIRFLSPPEVTLIDLVPVAR